MVVAAVPTGRPGLLLILTDTISKQWFLVDTGSAYSIIPHHSTDPATGPRIMAADRSPIPCWGEEVRTIAAAGRRFQWTFLLAAVAFPILGADFLRHFDLMVDLRRRRLVRPKGFIVPLTAPPPGCPVAPIGVVAADDSSPSPGTSSPSPGLSPPSPGFSSPLVESCSPPAVDVLVTRTSSISADSIRGELGFSRLILPTTPRIVLDDGVDVLVEFPGVVNLSKKLPPVRHSVEHVIETTCSRPIASRYRRLDPAKLEIAKREFADMEAQGIVRRSSSSWASPLHMVEKADGSWRPCGDYRLLNLATKPDLYPPPHMEDLSARLAGIKVFSKLDLRKGYHQVPVAAQDVQKTAVITPFGLFEFTRMPFGLRNAGQSFQRFMDEVLHGVQNTFVYLDDVLVASPTHVEHKQDLQNVLQHLKSSGLVLNQEKCVFTASQVEYLGHLVDASGIRPLPARVAAIAQFPSPTTRAELQRFLGMVNYYRRFLKSAAPVLKPLTDATRGPGGRNTKIPWSAEMATAFGAAKTALANAAVLVHPSHTADISLAVDASDSHVGGVLQQLIGDTWQPLSFFSKKLSAAESRYSAFDRELLACVAAIRHFRFLLEGRKFHILSDHKPLSFALHRMSDPWSARQGRHLSYVAEYTSEIRHVAGVENVVADSLSRPPAVEVQSAIGAIVPPASTGPLNWSAIEAGQSTCLELPRLQLSSSLHLQQVQIQQALVWCDDSTGQLRPVIPAAFRKQIFEHVHLLAHAGTRATTRLLSNRYVWPGLAADVKEWCRECVACQRAKVTLQPSTPVIKMEIPAQRFSHVHVDLLGPWPTSRTGPRYLLTIIDRSTRWFEATPLADITAELVLETFITSWVARFGVPEHVTTDRGAQFTSHVWTSWCEERGINLINTTAFHPQSNGMVERLHRQLKDALRARGAADDWMDHLPWVLLGLRAVPKDESGISAAKATLGQELVVPGQPSLPHVQHVESSSPPAVIPATKRSYAEVVSAPAPLDKADWVYVQRGPVGTPLSQNYDGPFEVLQRGKKTFQVRMGDRVEVVSRDRLKPHRAVQDPEAAHVPKRGRPARPK